MEKMREELLLRYPCLGDVIDSIDKAAQTLVDTYKRGGTVLV